MLDRAIESESDWKSVEAYSISLKILGQMGRCRSELKNVPGRQWSEQDITGA
jgi:hypothetical protein